MIARPRGSRREPSGFSDIQSTTGARMYAISAANTNGSSTPRPRMRIVRPNSGNPHRDRNFRVGLSAPNHVEVRLRVAAETGPVALPDVGTGTPCDGGSPGGSGGDISADIHRRHVNRPAPL